jgi:hypothetical protein
MHSHAFVSCLVFCRLRTVYTRPTGEPSPLAVTFPNRQVHPGETSMGLTAIDLYLTLYRLRLS